MSEILGVGSAYDGILWKPEGEYLWVDVSRRPDLFFLIWGPQNVTPEFTSEFTPEFTPEKKRSNFFVALRAALNTLFGTVFFRLRR